MKRAHSSAKLSVVRDAIDVVLRRLSTLPSTLEIEELRKKAEDFRQETDGWTSAPPAAEESGKVMKLVLKLHLEVAKLEREAGTERSPFVALFVAPFSQRSRQSAFACYVSLDGRARPSP
jgi:hypothetical protein